MSELRVLIDRIPYAEGNLGEEAILASLLQDLRALDVRQVAVFSNQPERTAARHSQRGVRVIADRPGKWWRLPLELAKAHLLIWGGGHMLQDRSSQLYIPYVVKTLISGRLLHRPRFIYAPGLGPVLGEWGRGLARMAIEGAKGITVRDRVSGEFLESIGLDTPFEVTADPAFSLRTEFDRRRDSKSENATAPLIGFAPRRHFYRYGSWRPVSRQIAQIRASNPRFEKFLQEAAALLDLLIVKFGARVRLLPMDLGPNPRDDLICFRLRNYMVQSDAVEILDDDPPLEEFVRRLGELDLLISARLHGIILGLRFGLPFIGIDSDGKITELANSLNLGDFAVKDAEFERERCAQLAEQALNGGKALRADLLQKAERLRMAAELNRAHLQRCLLTLR